jgi:hypothetical protein
MDDMHEIKELLSEIRDLQKAHFERYKEFTQHIVDREEASNEAAERARAEQRNFRNEVRHSLNQSQERIRMLQVTRWVIIGIVALVAAFAISGTAMSIFLNAIAN